MIKFILQKVRTLRWFIFLAVFFSSFIVFIGVTGISSLLYEKLMAEQATYISTQLNENPGSPLELPSITTEVRLAYISTFILYSGVFIIIAFIFSHYAIRRINRSIAEFSRQINQIQTGQDLENFNPQKLNFIFSELNQAFNNISELARQLGRVLNDKNLLEIKASLLGKLVIKNTRLENWNEYIKNTFTDISNTLPFDFICVYLTEKGQQTIKVFWAGPTNQAAKDQVERLLSQQVNLPINSDTATANTLKVKHHELSGHLAKDFHAQPKLLMQHLEKEPQVGFVQGVFIHSKAMQDVALRLRIDSILVVLLNLLGASRAISGYTQQLEKSIELSEQENSMAADVLYGHLLVKNTDKLSGISYQISSSSRFSGDVIQVKRSPSGSIFILIADATGHGLSATITIMPVISVFNAMVQKGHQLPYILNEMNKNLVRDLPDDRFVAAVLVEIDPSQQIINIWNGGMPAVLQLNPEAELIAEFSSKHMALGILDDELFDTTPQSLSLPKDGQLILYSDGLIEQEDPNQEAFGHQRLIKSLKEHRIDNSINSIIQEVLNHAGLEEPDDDISLCQINFKRIERKASNQQVLNLEKLEKVDFA